MPRSYLEKTLTALSGEHFVAGQLLRKGYFAALTLKNYPGVDLFVHNPKNRKQLAVQVKTKKGGRAFYVPENVEEIQTPFVFVYFRQNKHTGQYSTEYFIVPSSDVARISSDERDEYLRTHPHVKREQPRMIGLEKLGNFKDRWDLLDLE